MPLQTKLPIVPYSVDILPSHRHNCLHLIKETTSLEWKIIVAIEMDIYKQARSDKAKYKTLYSRILFALSYNSSIFENIELQQWTKLNRDQLCKGTATEQEEHIALNSRKTLNELISKLTEKPKNADDCLLKCKKCGSSSIDTDFKQTRSADEPMTVFCECSDCGSRWRM